MKIGFYDKNIGMSILRAEGTLVFMFVPYEMLILSVFKKLKILPIQNSHFLIFPYNHLWSLFTVYPLLGSKK